MYLIGESLNVISKKIGTAYKERDPKPIQEEALVQKKRGWITSTSISVRPKKTATNYALGGADRAGSSTGCAAGIRHVKHPGYRGALKVDKETPLPPLINSIMVRPERYDAWCRWPQSTMRTSLP